MVPATTAPVVPAPASAAPSLAGPLAGATLFALLASAPALAESERVTCGLNPPQSLVVIAGTGVLGEALVVGIDNPLGTQIPGACTFLIASLAKDSPTPCGTTAFGLSMHGYHVPGELVVSLDPLDLVGIWSGAPWAGPGTPSTVQLLPPDDPALVGLRIDLQGLVIDPSGAGAVVVGATEALRVTLEAASSPFAPRFEDLEIGARELELDVSGSPTLGAPALSESWSHEDPSPLTAFAAASAVQLVDANGAPVAEASGRHTSIVGARRIVASMEATAVASSALFDHSARARSELWVEFRLVERVRATLAIEACAKSGLSQGYAMLLGDGSQLFNATATDGATKDAAWKGWLEPCAYLLIAGNHSLVQMQDGTSDGSLELELRLLHAADANADGTVDAADRATFALEFALGTPCADMDGDGAVDAADQALFDLAWADGAG
ncbi:hypothetical protein [Planctomycetes bacterium Pla163]